MTIAIGSDHGGYELKLEVIKHLKDRGFEVTDYGCDSTASCDYPSYGKAVAEAIAAGKQDLGILICGTGIGMSMVANKVEGVRAALCSDCFSAQATREHNNAQCFRFGRVIRDLDTGMQACPVCRFVCGSLHDTECSVWRVVRIFHTGCFRAKIWSMKLVWRSTIR